MTKIERNKKIRAILISTSLIATLAGCSPKIYEDELCIYNGATIIDKNTGITINIPEKIKKEIISSNSETYTVYFGENKMVFETALLKKGITEQEKTTKESNFIGSALIMLVLGCLVKFKHNSVKTFEDTKESFAGKKIY